MHCAICGSVGTLNNPLDLNGLCDDCASEKEEMRAGLDYLAGEGKDDD